MLWYNINIRRILQDAFIVLAYKALYLLDAQKEPAAAKPFSFGVGDEEMYKCLPGEGSVKGVYARQKARDAEIQERIWKMRVDKMLYWFENERPIEEMTANLKINIE